MPGYDTASLVTSAWPNADSNGYGTPLFWLRYFTPCYFTPVNTSSSNANSECAEIWDSNSSSPMLGPITTPTQSRLSGSTAEGQADAQSLASALLTTYHDVVPLLLPTDNSLYCWLDQEASTSLSVSYWNGWSGYLDGYNFASLGTYPLYPCLYCNPDSPPPNCSTIGSSSANYCFAVWSSEPLRCGNYVKSPPSWAAENCSAYTSTPTRLWQFNDGSGICNSSLVDQDSGAPGFYTPAYCFYLDAKP
ncbi:MAG TPA: hypothetical protein VMC03_01010 [Streptosporangiaceae bacterium]|nr:hypothetical protein [Streptosporangiaceae bacterium]